MTTSTSLTPTQLAPLRAELENELAKLAHSMDTTAEAAQPVELDLSTVGEVSRMDAMANQQMAKDLHQRENALELSLNEALARMDEGTYGICTTCGEAIPYGRLSAMPEAATCAGCSR